MDNCKYKMDNGKRKMVNGNWKMKNEKLRLYTIHNMINRNILPKGFCNYE